MYRFVLILLRDFFLLFFLGGGGRLARRNTGRIARGNFFRSRVSGEVLGFLVRARRYENS